jgi:hypothetical protein
MMKKFLICLATISCLFCGAAYAQTQITKSMAAKLGARCLNNQRAMAIFANANDIVFSMDADKAAWNIVNHLDYAENFLIALYDGWGEESTYWTLREALFTQAEIKQANQFYGRVQEKRRILRAEQKAKEEEQRKIQLRKKIEAGHYFTKTELAVLPIIGLNVQEMLNKSGENRGAAVNLNLICRVSKNQEIEIMHTGGYSEYEQKLIGLIEAQIKNSIIKVGYVDFDGTKIPVNSILDIRIKEERKNNRSFTVYVKKYMRKKQVLWKKVSEGNYPGVISADGFTVLCDELNKNQELHDLPKGRYKLSITTSMPVFKYFINDKLESEVKMPILWDIQHTPYTLWHTVP